MALRMKQMRLLPAARPCRPRCRLIGRRSRRHTEEDSLPSSNRHPPVVPLDDRRKARIVFEQALAAETQEIISEMGILEAQFQELVIGDGEHLTVLDAL